VNTDEMASLPPGSCCYRGVKHEGEAKGELTSIGDIEAYVVKPEGQETFDKAILMYPSIVYIQNESQ
jgi:hypothetical protein